MAEIYPFRALRYNEAKVALEDVITQPYDKISPEMLARYRARSPYNLARIIKNPDYAGAARCLEEWRRESVLRSDDAPALYPYFQTYRPPGAVADIVRKGLIAAGRLEPYGAGVVFPHERTLAGPKLDRLELLRATRVHFGQLFMLFSDPAGKVDALLDAAAADKATAELRDEYGFLHQVWQVREPEGIAALRRAMHDKKLLIADGHHRYETALAFRDECRASARHGSGAGSTHACEAVMMTLVNMEAPGLTILPAHRLLARLPGFDAARFLASASRYFEATPAPFEEGMRRLAAYAAGEAAGVAVAGNGGPRFLVLRLRPETDLAALLPQYSAGHRRLDVVVLHDVLLRHCLGIDEAAVREERFLEYLREAARGWEAVAAGAPACFFLNPVRIEQVRDIAFAGGVMPQKSTDFFPKMLSGLCGYRVED